MIIGIGADIIDNRRIKATLKKYGEKFKNRCFTKNEIKKSEKTFLKICSYAKRFAAKEACTKALGTGFNKGIFWKDIEVVNDIYGKPSLRLHNRALSRLKSLSDSTCKIKISLSDEKNYSIANVIIYKDEK
jgi:holo-[acyl-carrier protein] synthase